MLEVGEEHRSKRGTTLKVLERDDDHMVFERAMPAQTGHADPHLHQDLTQTWTAVSGQGTIEVDGEERAFKTGDEVAVEPGVKHRDPWTSEGELVVHGRFDPCPPFIEAYADALVHHMTTGSANKQDEMPLLQILLLAKEYDGHSYSGLLPVGVQRAALPIAVALARLRGYKPSYDV